MAFQEAFKVVATGKEAKMEVNTDAFSVGKDLEGGVRTEVGRVQKKLDAMQSKIKTDLNTGELKTVWQAVESELEASIPDNFKGRYEQADWPTRASLIRGEILASVEQFMQNELGSLIKI